MNPRTSFFADGYVLSRPRRGMYPPDPVNSPATVPTYYFVSMDKEEGGKGQAIESKDHRRHFPLPQRDGSPFSDADNSPSLRLPAAGIGIS